MTKYNDKYEHKIFINPDVLFTMFQYASFAQQNFGSEIAGWAHWNKDKGVYKIAPLTSQEVPEKGLEVDMNPDEILAMPNYDISDMLVRWHSHVASGTSLSTTDNTTLSKLINNMPFIISIVVNVHWQFTCQLDMRIQNDEHGLGIDKYISIPCKLIPIFDVNDKRLSYTNDSIDKIVQQKIKVLKAEKKVPDFKDDDFFYYEYFRSDENSSVHDLLPDKMTHIDKFKLIVDAIQVMYPEIVVYYERESEHEYSVKISLMDNKKIDYSIYKLRNKSYNFYIDNIMMKDWAEFKSKIEETFDMSLKGVIDD